MHKCAFLTAENGNRQREIQEAEITQTSMTCFVLYVLLKRGSVSRQNG